jgi:transcriptional regulator with XRE-family HTH domain
MTTIGDRLDELMQAHPHYSGRRGQSALARKTGVSQPTISRILKGSGTPELGNVTKLAVEFGVTVEWLLSEREPKYQAEVRAKSGQIMEGLRKQDAVQARSDVSGTPSARYSELVSAIVEAAVEAEALGVPAERLNDVREILESLRDAQKAALAAIQKIDKMQSDAQSVSDRELTAAINRGLPGADKGIGAHERRGKGKSRQGG